MIDEKYWYSKKAHKYIQNIDTFYYSVKLEEDFRRDSKDWRVEKLRAFCEDYRLGKDGCCFYMNAKKLRYKSGGMTEECALFYRSGCYARYYTMRLQLPDKFDLFIAPVVPASAGDGESLSSEIVIQLRSRYLWEKGAAVAVKESFEYVKAFCSTFSLHIREVKENRCDFCWHTNAIQAPDKFFSDERIGNTFVTRLGTKKNEDGFKIRKVTTYKRNCDPSPDYIAIGNRSDKCFLRIYNKTKEVIQEGYKSWFLYIWFFQKMISRYDRYVLELAYKMRSWNYVDVARLKFALEHLDPDPILAAEIRKLIEPANGTYNYNRIRVLANELTPKVTVILNIEFQVMRAMTRSFELIPFKQNEGELKRVLDFLDNRALITDYLTSKTFRIVRPDSTDSNISRREDCDFWKRLRACKGIDFILNKHDLHLCRQYASKLDMSIRKKKAVRALSSVAYTITHDPDTSLYEDAAELLAILNDNDLHEIDNYKRLLSKRHQEDIPPDLVRHRSVSIVDDDTGEIL